MTKHYYLTKEQRIKILDSLNPEQRDFLTNYVRRGMATIYARKLAAVLSKNQEHRSVVDNFMAEWDFIKYTYISDQDWRAAGLRCSICNHLLRRQYTVENKTTGMILNFGIDHFAMHTGLPQFAVTQIADEMRRIDYELDELLQKISEGWDLPLKVPDDFEWPEEMRRQIELSLPLLQRQFQQLIRLLPKEPTNPSVFIPKTPMAATVPVKSTHFGYSQESNHDHALELRRRQGIRQSQTSDERKEYFERCLRQRMEFAPGLPQTEREIFLELLGKHGFSLETLPGVFGVDVEGSQFCKTPPSIWQLWIYDEFIYDKELSFRTADVIYKASSENVLRVNSYDWFYDPVSEYLRILSDLYIIRRVGNAYQPTQAEIVSLNTRRNVYLKIALEGHTPDESAIDDYRNSITSRGEN